MLFLLAACAPPSPATPTTSTQPPTETPTVPATDPPSEPVRDDFVNDVAFCATIEDVYTNAFGVHDLEVSEVTYTADGREIGITFPGGATLQRELLPGSWRWGAWILGGNGVAQTLAWTWEGNEGTMVAEDVGTTFIYRGTVDGLLLASSDIYTNFTRDVTHTYVDDTWRIASQLEVEHEGDGRTKVDRTWSWNGDEATILVERFTSELDADNEPLLETARLSETTETRTYTPDGQVLTVSRPAASFSGPGGSGSVYGTEQTTTYVEGWRVAQIVTETIDENDEVYSETVQTYIWHDCP